MNEDYWRSDRLHVSFPPGAFIVDVGCGDGWILKEALDRGCTGVGTELYQGLVDQTRARGCDALLAPAEKLPLEANSADGAIFAGVLPFTEEDQALAELARVLRPGGRVEAYYLAPGFGLRDFLLGLTLRRRYYGLRALVNTALTALIGRKLPGKFGDTVYATPRRIEQLYARHGFTLRVHTPSPTFLGLPVFIYHSAERAPQRVG